MKGSWNRYVTGFLMGGLFGLAMFVGCTRQLAVAPVQVPTSTPVISNTPTNSPTITVTSTSTSTLTPTLTLTSVFTDTFTMTDTPSSPTDTPTDTLSPTITNTSTNTPTITPTMTPTVDPNLIADFEEGGTADVSTNPLGLTGSWYEIGSSGTSPAPPAALTPTTSGGCNSSNFAEATGTTGTVAPIYAALQGDFASVAGTPVPYDISTHAASANAFVFCIKGSAPGGQVFFAVSDAATTESSDNAGINVPITGAWQSVTVCFNHMQSQGFGVTTVGHMFDPTTAVSFSWKVVASSSSFDIGIDNFSLATVPGGTCPAFTATPTPNPLLIDDMEDGDNEIKAQNGRDGYWYCFLDQYYSGIVNTPVNLASHPLTVVNGETAASNPITLLKTGTALNTGTVPAGTTIVWGQSTANTGTNGATPWVYGAPNTFVMSAPGDASNYCAELKGSVGPACTANDPVSTGSYQICPFVGMGFDFINPNGGPKTSYDLTSYTGVQFYAKVAAGTTTQFRVNFPLPLTTAIVDGGTCGATSNCSDHYQVLKTFTTGWVQYSIALTKPPLAQQGFGPVVTWDPSLVYGMTWEADNGSFGQNVDLSVDNVFFY